MTDPLLSPFISGFLGPTPRDADGPRLDPRPPGLVGGGDAILNPGVSILADLREDLPPALFIFCGMAGTGGASYALGTGEDLDGDGSRKVRSVIEPELPLLTKVEPGGPRTEPPTELPAEEVEPFLRIVLLVWISATDVGVVGLDRNAAAAAAEDKEAFDVREDRNACAAAVVADALTLVFTGCKIKLVSIYYDCGCMFFQKISRPMRSSCRVT